MTEQLCIRISYSDWADVRRALLTTDGNENAAVLLCGTSNTKTERRLLVRKILSVPPESYEVRTGYRLKVSPAFYNRVIDLCLSGKLNPVLIHSHPSADEPWYSTSDDFGESRLLPVLEELIPGAVSASLLLSRILPAGRRYLKGKFGSLTSLTVVGPQVQTFRFSPRESTPYSDNDQFDRQVLAIGPDGQKLIAGLKVGLVGVGGTGSIVAEQLARLGVRDFTIVDPDEIEQSNVSRLFGSRPKDVGAPKVKVIRAHLLKLGTEKVFALKDNAIRQGVLTQLRDSDILFSCVDNDRSRALLSRFAYQYLIPVIDMGIRLDGRSGEIRAAAGRVSVLGPGMVCLRCSHHVNPDRIRAESLPPSERQALAKEGYVMGIDEPAPAVVSLNTTIGGLAVTAALNMFLNLTGGVQPVDQLYDASEGIVFTARSAHQAGCDICDEAKGVKGLGDIQIVSAYD